MRRGGAVVAASSAREKTRTQTGGAQSPRSQLFTRPRPRPGSALLAPKLSPPGSFALASPPPCRRRVLEPSRGDLGRGWPWRRRRGLRPPRCSSSSAQVLLSPSPSSARPPLSNLSRRVDAVASDWLMFRALTW
jgi:hypothetical protein